MPKTTHTRLKKEEHEKLKELADHTGEDMTFIVSALIDLAHIVVVGEAYQDGRLREDVAYSEAMELAILRVETLLEIKNS